MEPYNPANRCQGLRRSVKNFLSFFIMIHLNTQVLILTDQKAVITNN